MTWDSCRTGARCAVAHRASGEIARLPENWILPVIGQIARDVSLVVGAVRADNDGHVGRRAIKGRLRRKFVSLSCTPDRSPVLLIGVVSHGTVNLSGGL